MRRACKHDNTLHFIFSLLLISIGVSRTLFAEPLHPSWIPKNHPAIGDWVSSELTLSLKASGEAMIKQRHLLVAAQRETLHPIKNLKGYWWVDHGKICLSFMLRPQCIAFKHSKHKEYRLLSFQFNSKSFELRTIKN